VCHFGQPRSVGYSILESTRESSNVASKELTGETGDVAAYRHSRHALWIHGYMHRVEQQSQIPKAHHALCSAGGNLASLVYSTVSPDRTQHAYSFATRFCSLQISCRVPKHPLAVLSWPRITDLSRRISGQRMHTSGVHSPLQRRNFFCLPQQPVYHPIHFAAIGR
jgi:hypothetical protein